MLDELHVSNIALIEDATIAFSPGLTVLTGETGAGKTALLAALKLICGARADASVVRDGAEEALAEARLVDGDEHIVRRRLSVAGRSRCAIDGAMATVGELVALTSSIEVHGQHEQVLLLDPARQLAYLDSWAQDDGLVAEYARARADYLEARRTLEELERARGKDEQELEFMRFTCEQIEKVNPQPGELEELEDDLPRLQHADQLAQALQDACAALHDDGGALDLIARSVADLMNQQGIDDELDELAARLDGQMRDLEDLTRDLSAYAHGIDTDPRLLEDTRERRDKLNGLMRRFGPGMEQVFATWQAARRAIESAQDSPQRMEEASARLAQAEDAYRHAAVALSAARHDAARTFCEQLASSVTELAMEGARFEFSFDELGFERWGETGSEQIELLYQPAPTSKPRPLRRIASGGELSRILLALECMHYASAGHDGGRTTIIFDEVDSGIGGATGNAVARRLATLSKGAQVIVVTHLAQVAALADEHYVVSKQSLADALPHTSVEPVTGEARVAEIARMLSGDDDERALDHARSLLEAACR